MKLFYSPGACSMAAHILLEETGKAYACVSVDIRDAAHRTSSGEDFLALNPKGYVPALVLDSGDVLTENSALLPWIAAQDPQRRLMPAEGTLDNYRVHEWLGFIGTEIHKSCSPLFRPDAPPEVVKSSHAALKRRLGYVNEALAARPYLIGEAFTPADAYLFVVLSWFAHLAFDLAPYPHLQAFQARVGARPSVQKVLRAEGLA